MNKLAVQSIVLDSIQCEIDDFIEVKLHCSSLNEKVVVSFGDNLLKGEVRWGKGEFVVNIPFLDLKEKLSCHLFNEIDSSWWLSYDNEFKSSSDGEFFWESINDNEEGDKILKSLENSGLDLGLDIDELANEIYRDGDIIDNDYSFSHAYQLNFGDDITFRDDFSVVDGEWESDFILALGICADQFFEYKAKGFNSDLHELLKESLWSNMSNEDYSKIWPKGLALRSKLVDGIGSWDELYANIKSHFIEKEYKHSISSEMYLSRTLKEMWRSRLGHDDRVDITPKPVYSIEFDGSSDLKPFGYPKWNSGTLPFFDFIYNLDKAMGGSHFMKCFIASLDNDYQVFQVAYPLIASSKYMSYDLGLIKFILKLNAKGFPYLNKIISENPYYAENCWDSLNREDAFTIAGLTSGAGGYDTISEFISREEFDSLSDSISKVPVELRLVIEENHQDYEEDYEEIEGDEVRVFRPIGALLHMECGNSIQFDSFRFHKSVDNNSISQVNSLKEYIALYRNNFYKQLWYHADYFLLSFRDEDDKERTMSGGQYLETYGKWELTYGEVILRSDHLFGDFKESLNIDVPKEAPKVVDGKFQIPIGLSDFTLWQVEFDLIASYNRDEYSFEEARLDFIEKHGLEPLNDEDDESNSEIVLYTDVLYYACDSGHGSNIVDDCISALSNDSKDFDSLEYEYKWKKLDWKKYLNDPAITMALEISSGGRIEFKDGMLIGSNLSLIQK